MLLGGAPRSAAAWARLANMKRPANGSICAARARRADASATTGAKWCACSLSAARRSAARSMASTLAGAHRTANARARTAVLRATRRSGEECLFVLGQCRCLFFLSSRLCRHPPVLATPIMRQPASAAPPEQHTTHQAGVCWPTYRFACLQRRHWRRRCSRMPPLRTGSATEKRSARRNKTATPARQTRQDRSLQAEKPSRRHSRELLSCRRVQQPLRRCHAVRRPPEHNQLPSRWAACV